MSGPTPITPNLAGACNTGACDCDPNSVITQMVEERGTFSNTISQEIQQCDDFLRLLEPTKNPFPSGQGDYVKRLVLDVAQPSERDVLGNQKRLQSANPGQSPCDIPCQTIPYGSRTVEACLYGWCWETDWFCKTDLAFKYQRDQQIQQIKDIMVGWAKGIWSKWVRRAYQRNVQNYTLAGGLPNRHGAAGYVTDVVPASILTVAWLDQICLRLADAAGMVGSPKKGNWIIFGGHEEIKCLFDEYHKAGARDYGVRMHRSAEDYKRHDMDLGCDTYTLNNYTFIATSHPARYRDLAVGENHWDEGLLDTIIQVPSQYGTESMVHPDFRNPAIAKYSEWYIINTESVEWLTPPVGMTENNGFHVDRQASNGNGSYSYAGEFVPVRCPEDKDPMGKKVKYHAEFVAGMISKFPKRGAAILAQSCHICAEAISVDCELNPITVTECCVPVRETQPLLTPGRIQINLGQMPVPVCQDGQSLFLKTAGDKVAGVTVIRAEQCEATGDMLAELQFNDPELGGCVPRDCDPWKQLCCLDGDTVDDPLVDDGGCPLCPGSGSSDDGNKTAATTVQRVNNSTERCATYQGSKLTKVSFASDDYKDIEAKDATDLREKLEVFASDSGAKFVLTEGTQQTGWKWTLCIDGAGEFSITGANSKGEETEVAAE